MNEIVQAFIIALGILVIVAVFIGLIAMGAYLIDAGQVIPGAIVLFLVLLAITTCGVYYVRH